MKKALRIIGILLILCALGFYIAGVKADRMLGIHLLILGLGLYFLLRVPRLALKPIRWPSKRRFFIQLGWFVFFFAVVFFFQFWRFKAFGLYEMDFFKVVPTFSWRWYDLWHYCRNALFSPLTMDSAGDMLTAVFSFIGYQIGGLQSIYLISMFVPAAISFLFFLIFKKLFGYDLAGLFAALLFIFYPAYRTPQFLYLTFSKQAALLLMLCSLHAFLHQRKLLSELLMFATMIIVKAYAPIFLLFPLFQINVLRKELWRDWLDHLKTTAPLLLFIIIALSLQSGIRQLINRVADTLLIPIRFYKAFTEGSFGNGFVNFAASPIALFYNFSLSLGLVFLVGWIVFAAVFILNKPTKKASEMHYKIRNSLLSLDIKLMAVPGLLDSMKFFLVSLVILVFSFTGFDRTAPTNIYEHSSSVSYLVSALPMMLLFSSFFMGLFLIPQKTHLRVILIVLAAAFLSLLGVDRFLLQSRAVQSWRVDQWFWSNVLAEVGTLSEENTLVIPSNPEQNLSFNKSQNFEIFHGKNLMPLLFEPDPDWSVFPEVIVTADVVAASPQDNLKTGGRFLRFYILNGQLYAEEVGGEDAQALSGQIPICELAKKPLYDLIVVNDFAGKSLNTVLGQETSNDE